MSRTKGGFGENTPFKAIHSQLLKSHNNNTHLSSTTPYTLLIVCRGGGRRRTESGATAHAYLLYTVELTVLP